MTAHQFSDLVSGMLVVEKIKARFPAIYRGLIPKIKDLTTATEVATHAETLRVQYDNGGHATETTAFASKTNANKGQREENYWSNHSSSGQRGGGGNRSDRGGGAGRDRRRDNDSNRNRGDRGGGPSRYSDRRRDNDSSRNESNRPQRDYQNKEPQIAVTPSQLKQFMSGSLRLPDHLRQTKRHAPDARNDGNKTRKKEGSYISQPQPPNNDSQTILRLDQFIEADFRE